MDERLHALPGPPARGRRDRGGGPGGGAHPGRHVPAPAERPPRAARLRAARPPDPACAGSWSSTRATGRRGRGRSGPATSTRWRRAAWPCCGSAAPRGRHDGRRAAHGRAGGSGGSAIPGATYRLQLGANLTFRDARDLVPYLAELGITDCYLSPILQPCAPGSHGYDVADHGQSERGPRRRGRLPRRSRRLSARTGWASSSTSSRTTWASRGGRNAWWQDVLENGRGLARSRRSSTSTGSRSSPSCENRVLLPILEDHYGRILENQELRLQYEDGAFLVRYHDTVLPIDPSHVSPDPDLPAAGARGRRSGAGDPHVARAPGRRRRRRRAAGADGDRTRAPGRARPRQGARHAPAGRARRASPRP